MNLRSMIKARIIDGQVVSERPIKAVDNQAAVVFLVDNEPYPEATQRHHMRRGVRYRMLTRFQRDSVE